MKFNGININISPLAKMGLDVRIGDHTSVYPNTEIGDHSTIANQCEIGEPLAPYYSDPAYKNPPLRIGAKALVRSHSILYAGSEIGECLGKYSQAAQRHPLTCGNASMIKLGGNLRLAQVGNWRP